MSSKEQIRESLIFEGGDESATAPLAPAPSRAHRVYEYDAKEEEPPKELTAKEKKMIAGCCSSICCVIGVIIVWSMFSSDTVKKVAAASTTPVSLRATPALLGDAYRAKLAAEKPKKKTKRRNCSDSGTGSEREDGYCAGYN